ncbi:hypothetical protein DQP57_03825 [Mycobacterium colombiense]|uniref:Transglycosylase SLT domain-containing protein n=2 Tax=Mycobacteriaceae TaxID=1762 RepID=A0A329M7X4_9MYCO|nr:hypothetical protein DQP57_03825 [Mycobacterium colombiense]
MTGAAKESSQGIADSIRDGISNAAQDGGKSLSDALVHAAAEGGRALGTMVGESSVGHWLQDMGKSVQGFKDDYITPAVDGVLSLADGFKALQSHDVAGGLSSVADGLTKIGQSDAAKTVQDLAEKAQPLQDEFLGLKGSIEGTAEGLMSLAGNSGKIAGGLEAISAAAGPLAATFAMLQAIPGWSEGASGVLDQIQGKKGFNAQDWFHTLTPGTGIIDQALGPVTNGPDPTKGFRSPITAKPGVSAIPLPGSAPAVEPGYTAATGSMDPFAALGSPGAPKAAPSGNSGGGLDQWIAQAQAITGVDASWTPGLKTLIGRESSGNPSAINLWDSNAKAGHPSQGLMQLIPGNFQTYHVPGTAGDINDPVANIAAGIRYIQANYGSISNVQQANPNLVPKGYDDGGLLPPGLTLAHNETGKPELVLTQDQLAGSQAPPQGIDMGALLGQGQGQGNDAMQGLFGAPGGKDLRTQGYIPAGAGGGGAAGTSFISGSLQMGAQAINGLIDQAASAASQAASMGANAFAPGSGGAAGAAASSAIGIGTQAAKRGVQYGFQMAGIAGDAATEILMPFGVPRFFQTDPTQFMPQLPGQAAAVTTGEKAEQSQDNPAAANQPGMNPAGPVQPGQLPGQQPVGSPAQIASPGTGDFTPAAVGTPALSGTNQTAPQVPDINAGPMPKGPASAGVQPAAPAPAPKPSNPPGPLDFLPLDMPNVYDDGGWLMPGQIGINKSNAPEPLAVFTPEQWGALGAVAKGANMRPDPTQGASYDYRTVIENVTVKDVNELMNEASSRQRLQMMRHAGRP